MIGIILVLVLTYVCTKSISKGMLKNTVSSNMSIIDKVPLGQNKYIAIMCICDKYYLISITDNNINLLKELDDNIILKNNNYNNKAASFKDLLNEAILHTKKSSKSQKGNSTDETD